MPRSTLAFDNSVGTKDLDKLMVKNRCSRFAQKTESWLLNPNHKSENQSIFVRSPCDEIRNRPFHDDD